MKHLNKDVQRLQYAFSKASRHVSGKALKGTDLYNHQVDFMYLLNDIVQGPEAVTRRAITQANGLINSLLEPKSA